MGRILFKIGAIITSKVARVDLVFVDKSNGGYKNIKRMR